MLSERDGETRDPLTARLDALAQFGTHLPFSQLFCRLVVVWSWEAGDEAEELRGSCLRFLDAELRYHQTLADLSERERVSYEDLRSIADKRRIHLTALAERIEQTTVRSSRAGVVKYLLLAECHYHLRETQATVADLEAALASGGGHPIVHFALGYNRFDQARELHALAQMADRREVEKLESEFRAACLSAADAFRDGLTGQEFDAQLHYWIGRSLAAAGLTEEAEAALQTAAHIDPSIFDRQPIVDEAAGQGEPEPVAAPAEVEPITEEEVRLAGELFKRRWRREEVMGEDA